MKLENGSVHLEIEDNGRGFDPGEAHHGNGLNNIRTRMAENGGSAEIMSATGKGTRVRMRFPLAPPAWTSI
jgi:two-component system sensor histidine kinase UhpB